MSIELQKVRETLDHLFRVEKAFSTREVFLFKEIHLKMTITLLLLIILVIRWVCEHQRNKPLQDMFLTYGKYFKIPRCNRMVIS